MTDPKFEAKLRSALLELNREELEEVEKLDPIEPSPRYLQWRMRFLADPFRCAKKYARPTWRKVLRIALSAVLAVLLTFGTVLAVYPPARQWVAEWFENYTRFMFVSESNDYRTPGRWYPDYLPDGFSFIEEKVNGVTTTVVFTNNDGTRINLLYAPQNYISYNIDSEHQTFSEIVLTNGNLAISADSGSANDWNYLIWTDSKTEIAFRLMSTINIQELIIISNSIQLS